MIDETRRSFSVNFQGIAVSESNLPQARLDVIEHASLLLMSAEASGGIAGALNVIVDYLKTRKQFDKQIGSYQALKHPTVDILMGLEMSLILRLSRSDEVG